MGSCAASSSLHPVKLIHLRDADNHASSECINNAAHGSSSNTAPASKTTSPHNSSSSAASKQLIQEVCKGLSHHSVPLSAAAAHQLLKQQQQQQQYSPSTQQDAPSKSNPPHTTPSTSSSSPDATIQPDTHTQPAASPSPSSGFAAAAAAPAAAAAAAAATGAPVLLRSLPVELLYDDRGLSLFDDITHLPEYYLTGAEADILSRHGPDIVAACVGQGALLVELGAGSMHKTRLLLDALLSRGVAGVSFVALDLCEASLRTALEQLRASYPEGSISFTGMVGTYQQGLAYINTHQQDLTRPDSQAGSQPDANNSTGPDSSSQPEGLETGSALIKEPDAAAATAAVPAVNGVQVDLSRLLAPAGPEDSDIEGDEGVGSGSTADSSTVPASSAPDVSDGAPSDGLPSVLSDHSSSNSISSGSLAGNVSSSSSAGTIEQGLDAAGHASSKEGRAMGNAQGSSSSSSSPPKVIMWLGSSIGNYSRSEAAAFLQQLRELAMQPGDVLLVGIDRRNPPAKVQAAYNDPSGITRAFIMNGLHHAAHLLDQEHRDLLGPELAVGLQAALHEPSNQQGKSCQRPGDNAASIAASSRGSSSIAASSNGSKSSSSGSSSLGIRPDDFQYFCLYNEELGRHEAYYQASRDTVIVLPGGWETAGTGAAKLDGAAGTPLEVPAAEGGAGGGASNLSGSVSCSAIKGDGSGSSAPAAAEMPVAAAAASAAAVVGGCNGWRSSVHASDSVGVVVLPTVTAGELIHIEYSYKYSREEVLALAGAAGLEWVRAWTDSQEQYDLHMFSHTMGKTGENTRS